MASVAVGGYAVGTTEDKEVGNGFEFTRRKKWPQLLLQELVGSALFCLKPYPVQRASMDNSGRSNNTIGWKMTYISPWAGEMIGQKASELENRDFFDLVFPADQPGLQSLLSSLVVSSSAGSSSASNSTPSSGAGGGGAAGGPSSVMNGRSHTTHARILSADPSGDRTRSGPVIWELRVHATGAETASERGTARAPAFRLDGSTAPSPSGDEAGLKGKAVWIMGRRVGEAIGEDNAQSLDAFLELKLENEKLREELKELQNEMDEEDFQAARSYLNPISVDVPSPTSSSPTPSSDSASSSASSPRKEKEKKKPGRPPKDPKDREREKKRAKKLSTLIGGPGGGGAGGMVGLNLPSGGAGSSKDANNAGAGGGEGMHVCVTCGRTDSPEWRKGPLGPKTLCNACGLRWAKRNSTQPSRKEKKAAEAAAAARKA